MQIIWTQTLIDFYLPHYEIPQLSRLTLLLGAAAAWQYFGKPYGLIYGFGINFSSGFDLPNITKTKLQLGSYRHLLSRGLHKFGDSCENL